MKILLDYLKGVVKEVKLVSFPTKNDLYLTSINVFIIIFLAMILILCTDMVISKLLKLILGII